jgi:hypothetical protein
MSDRIKELVARDFIPDCNGDILTTPESIRNFAEDIVRNCIAITNDQYFAYEAVEELQEYFGVKE